MTVVSTDFKKDEKHTFPVCLNSINNWAIVNSQAQGQRKVHALLQQLQQVQCVGQGGTGQNWLHNWLAGMTGKQKDEEEAQIYQLQNKDIEQLKDFSQEKMNPSLPGCFILLWACRPVPTKRTSSDEAGQEKGDSQPDSLVIMGSF